MKEKDITNNGLKPFIDALFKHVDEQLDQINNRLDKMDSHWEKIDDPLRGVGKTGINGRSYSLETLKPSYVGNWNSCNWFLEHSGCCYYDSRKSRLSSDNA